MLPRPISAQREMSLSKVRAALLLAVLLAGQAVAGPSLSGLFKGEQFGLVEFSTEDGYVSGKYLGGGECSFEDRRRVIEGQFEGNVLVARVLVCQQGVACGQKFYDVIAFYNPTEGTLTGELKLDNGCHSEGLAFDKWLKLRSDEGRKVPVVKTAQLKRNEAAGQLALKQAHQLMLLGKYDEAREKYLTGLSFQERNWAAYLGLGVAEIKLGHELAAIEALEHSVALKPDASDTYYNLACAWARLGDRHQALQNVKRALKLGGVDKATLEEEPDLAALRDDPDWERILSSADNENR